MKSDTGGFALLLLVMLGMIYMSEGDPDIWDLSQQAIKTWLNDYMCPIK